MAKARQIDNLDCDASVAAAASEVLRVRFDEILEFQAAAIEPNNINGVHDMRVASRRFRSALKDFKPIFEKRALKPLKTNVKEIGDALGVDGVITNDPRLFAPTAPAT